MELNSTPRAANENARPMTKAAATKAVRARLVWDRDEPEEERRLGTQEARWLRDHRLNNRVTLLRLAEALQRGPFEFLAELQRSEPFASEPAGLVSLDLFESYLFGAASDGVDGAYGRAFLAEFAARLHYAKPLH